ncbi:MAG: CDP-alcohol phosphatidyltransferase family protein [Acidimicrobiales bacterium]
MFDARLRRGYGPLLARVARAVHGAGIGALQLTAVGLALGLVAAGLAAAAWWWAALGCWLASRVVDGLDGAVARLEGTSPRGGFVGIVADFTVYAAFVVGIAVAIPEARLAAVVLLGTYYVSGAAFLAWSSAAAEARARRTGAGLALDDDRTVRFVGGLAEGFETIVAYAVVCVVPDRAEVVLWAFALLVGVTALQRVVFAFRDLAAIDTP